MARSEAVLVLGKQQSLPNDSAGLPAMYVQHFRK
ncbi:hypothetical protein Pjdr2_4109 [Paenibacillus sp. JDR-2]|nr:hypothetical protein Pjdr2_4109 [Paenibacillus sp. JDR-2]